MLNFGRVPHHMHVPHLDKAASVLLVFVIASVALAMSFDWAYRALLS